MISDSSIKDLRSKIKAIRFCMFTTTNDDFILTSRPMTQQSLDDDGVFWFFTSDTTELARDLLFHSNVNVSFSEPADNLYVSLSAEAMLVKDRVKAAELWSPMVAVWYPEGLNDPHLTLIKCRIHRAEYWDSHTNKMLQLFSMAKAVITGGIPKDVSRHEKINFQ